ncbi:MAG: pseudouridine synthase [Candidatus Ratteibacteria bacterium]|jgi:23S rRNA pseudouridine2605 synthase
MKLNLYLARSGVASRRKSAELIKEGRVSVNGETVLVPSREVAGKDKVSVDGKKVAPERFVYIAVNKPIGFTCTLKDRFAEKKVTDLVPRSLGRLYPVGRLDRDSSGLVILTNDGDFSQRLSHPSYEAEKEYLVTVTPPVSRKEAAVLKAGVLYEAEKLSASEVVILNNDSGKSTLQVILKEGKKREIRRMFGCLGHHVLTLRRMRIGNIMLGKLELGKHRFLTEEEITT